MGGHDTLRFPYDGDRELLGTPLLAPYEESFLTWSEDEIHAAVRSRTALLRDLESAMPKSLGNELLELQEKRTRMNALVDDDDSQIRRGRHGGRLGRLGGQPEAAGWSSAAAATSGKFCPPARSFASGRGTT